MATKSSIQAKARIEAAARLRPRQIDIEDLPGAGWLRFCERGEENTYFAHEDGTIVFVKI